MRDKKFQKEKRKLDDFIKYSNMAFEMIAIMAVGTFAGYKLDHWLKMDFPAFTLGLMIISVIGAVYRVIRKFL